MEAGTTILLACKFARKAPGVDAASTASDLAASDQVEKRLDRG
jgi:hypothetical protein